jgi:spore germination protein PE
MSQSIAKQTGARTSHVHTLNVTNISLSGIVQLGDHSEYNPVLRALAVQRETDHAKEDKVYFESYMLFSRPLPDVCDHPFFQQPLAADTEVELFQRVNRNPNITVGCISALGVGASSLLQIGNGCSRQTESRIKHIRQFSASRPFVTPRPVRPGVNIFPR